MEKYEQPGVKINSKPPSKEYKDNYEQIFGKKESWLDKRLRKEKEASCLDAAYEQEAVKVGLNKNPIFEENITLLQEMKAEMQEKIKHDNCTD